MSPLEVVQSCMCTPEVCFEDDCSICLRIDPELPCPAEAEEEDSD